MRTSHYPTLIALLSLSACVNLNEKKVVQSDAPLPTLAAAPLPASFNNYWYQGKAEITSFEVQQERYGEIRKAEQVNVFVTEDFSKQKQVKLDDAGKAGTDRVPVLKLNAVRRYHTGIYDYSMMQSVFTPVDGSKTLKTTCSVQDWCGQVFCQYNLKDKGYQVHQFSYFETEGDSDTKIGAVPLLEDELWVRLRLNPDNIPAGKVSLVPASFFLRLRHKPVVAHPATLTIEKGGAENTLQIRYDDMPRSLAIRFEASSPYRILGWEEKDGEKLMSKGTKKASVMSPYWSQHNLEHDGLRDSLKLVF